MHLYHTRHGRLVQLEDQFILLNDPIDMLINRENLHQYLKACFASNEGVDREIAKKFLVEELLPPIGSQEVWAAGVTYLRSRDARMEESEDAGAADCYQRVYEAARPELFFKSLSHRVAGPGETVNIRKDSGWNVPEPELTLFINSLGQIQAYTIGNDMSSRSIEGENPLYLPQAKMYERSAALGPCLFVPEHPIGAETTIRMEIFRGSNKMFDDATSLNRMKRKLTELADWLFREMEFSQGVFLMTGTCVVPPNDFTLSEGDQVQITIDGIGTLSNPVGINRSGL